MAQQRLETSWMWPVSDGVNALIIKTDTRRLHWFDQMGCVCMDDDSLILIVGLIHRQIELVVITPL